MNVPLDPTLESSTKGLIWRGSAGSNQAVKAPFLSFSVRLILNELWKIFLNKNWQNILWRPKGSTISLVHCHLDINSSFTIFAIFKNIYIVIFCPITLQRIYLAEMNTQLYIQYGPYIKLEGPYPWSPCPSETPLLLVLHCRAKRCWL